MQAKNLALKSATNIARKHKLISNIVNNYECKKKLQ